MPRTIHTRLGSGRLQGKPWVCLYSSCSEVTARFVFKPIHAVAHGGDAKTLTSHVDTYTFLLRRSDHSQLRCGESAREPVMPSRR